MASIHNCPCDSCFRTRERMDSNTWLHWGIGNMTEKELNSLPHGTEIPTTEIFRDPKLELDRYGKEKPHGSIWASCGTWMFDPYADNYAVHENGCDPKKLRFIVLDNPQGVLQINTIDDLKEFEKQYQIPKKSTDTRYALYHIEIDWEKVKQDWYGIAVRFRKVINVGGRWEDHLWHSGWDVESLAVWDLRAFNSHVEVRDVVV